MTAGAQMRRDDFVIDLKDLTRARETGVEEGTADEN
jgi:hypothetical protein